MNRSLRVITNTLETILATPILGGVIVISMNWYPLLIMLALHIVTLIVSNKNNDEVFGSALGIITSCLGWIPLLGWTMHVITAVVLLIENISYEENPDIIQS